MSTGTISKYNAYLETPSASSDYTLSNTATDFTDTATVTLPTKGLYMISFSIQPRLNAPVALNCAVKSTAEGDYSTPQFQQGFYQSSDLSQWTAFTHIIYYNLSSANTATLTLGLRASKSGTYRVRKTVIRLEQD